MYLFTFQQSNVILSQRQEKRDGKKEIAQGSQQKERAGKKVEGWNALSFRPSKNTV